MQVLQVFSINIVNDEHVFMKLVLKKWLVLPIYISVTVPETIFILVGNINMH